MKMPNRKEVEAHMFTWPGKRGEDIPEHVFDKIHPVANGITQQIWGRGPTPFQLQHLYDNGHHTPEAIHDAYGQMPHPHSPSTSVAEYEGYSKALELFQKHQGNK